MTPARRPRRAAAATTATVEIWGRRVGVIAEATDSGALSFQYDDVFADGGIALSPFYLPLNRGRIFSFPALRTSPAFLGLPGLLADALPDAFGNAVIRRYFESQGRAEAALSPVQRLLYIGRRGMGALEFVPPTVGPHTAATEEALHLQTLVQQARAVVEGDTTTTLNEIMQVGGSAGGARAKAIVLWNPASNQLRAGAARPKPGDEPWLIKFDGVSAAGGGHLLASAPEPGPWGRIEFAYSELARKAGIDMSPTHLFRDGPLAHFGTKRFDRTDTGARVHVHTYGGLQHIDYNISGATSYEAWFDTLRALGMPQPAVDQAFLRMAFSIASRNQDDHVKNIACCMLSDGRWTLAPAYDVTWALDSPWTRQHQMSVRGKLNGITPSDVREVAAQYDVPHAGAHVMAAVDDALAAWPDRAKAAGVPLDLANAMALRFRRLITVY